MPRAQPVTPVKTGVQHRAVLRGERVLLTMDMVKLDSGFRRNDALTARPSPRPSFPIFIWTRSIGGDAGEGSAGADGGV